MEQDGGSSAKETVVLPDHPMLKTVHLPWSHLYEIARLFQGSSEQHKKEIVLEDWIQLASQVDNPADLQGLLLKSHQDSQPRISSALKFLLKQVSKEELPSLQRRIGGFIKFDLSRQDKKFSTDLQPLELCQPNELNRTYGAERFLHAKLTEKLIGRLRVRSSRKTAIQKAFEDFIHTPIRVGNRLFFFIIRKEAVLWLVSPDEANWLSTKHFINQVLDLKLNKNMTIAKWVARTALPLSGTRSSIDINPQDIRRVPDLYSDSLIISRELLVSVADTLGLNYLPSCIQGSIRNKPLVWRLGVPDQSGQCLIQLWDDQIGNASKHVFIRFRARRYDHLKEAFTIEEEPIVVPLNKCMRMGAKGGSEIMTDGAGMISRAAAERICKVIGKTYENLPAAYQGRIGFSKGLWTLPPDYNPSDVTPWIEIRDSQWKAEPVDGFHFHFNLCRISRPVCSSHLGKQVLPILSSRGVKSETLCLALEKYIRSTVEDINTKDPLRLAQVLFKSPTLKSNRREVLARTEGIQHDVRVYRSSKEDKLDWNPIPDFYESCALTEDKLDAMSLNPINTEEQVINMLAAGFDPTNRYIVHKLRRIKEDRILNAIKFRVPIDKSAFVYVLPDPTGTLEEDEVFLQFSDFTDRSIGAKISRLTGPVLVTRAPAVGPIDVRKVKLVENEILRETYFDVLVCPIKGKNSLLHLLSGGDYDGDQVTVTWDTQIVEQFQNVDAESYARLDVSDCFQAVQVGSVKKCLLGLYETDSAKFVKKAQSIQISALFAPNDTGSYSFKHTTAEYALGLNHPLTQKLGEVYIACLDASKAGLALQPSKDQIIREELEKVLKELKHPDGKKVVHFKPNHPPIPKFLAENSKLSKAVNKTFEFISNGQVHILDALLKKGYSLLKKYKDELNVKDIGTHMRRFNDRDYDLCQLFREQKKCYEFDRSMKGSLEIWIGVLRPLQRAMHDLAKDYCKIIVSSATSRVRDEIWESEYGAGTAGPAKGAKIAFRLQEQYHSYSYEKAFEFLPDADDVESYCINLDEFKLYISSYLEGLGPIGYSLLKASCLAMCSNPEAFIAYEIAYREICFLKAMSIQNKKFNNLNLDVSSEDADELLSCRPPRSITTPAYLSNIVKPGVVIGRPNTQDVEPV